MVKKKTKRIKISFGEVNKGKIEMIDPNKISESKQRIKKEMKKQNKTKINNYE
jgi:hypothetical protein